MFLRVDVQDGYNPVQGYSYENREGYVETVEMGTDLVIFKESSGASATVFNQDIPKLIKALQAAYDHIQKGK